MSYGNVADGIIARLEQNLEDAKAQIAHDARRARTAENVLEAVREVHQPLDALHTNTGRVRQVCTGCGTDDGNWQVWPCPTIRAIERKS